MSVCPSHDLLCLSPLSSLPPLCSFMTPLHVAAERAHNDIMEVLQKHGAKVHSWSCISRRHIPACALECLQSCDTHIYTPNTLFHHPPLTAHSIVRLKGKVHQKIAKICSPSCGCKSVCCYFFVGEKTLFSSNSSSGQREGENWSFKTTWTVFVQEPFTDIVIGPYGEKIYFFYGPLPNNSIYFASVLSLRKISSVEQHFCHIYLCVQLSHHVSAARGEE